MPILGPVCTDDPTCSDQTFQGTDNFTGNVTVAGTLAVAGATSLKATSQVGNSSQTGNSTRTGTLANTGAVTITGVLTQAGNENITGTLGVTTGGIDINTAGQGLRIKTGSNAKAGTFTANGTTPVTVATTAFIAGSTVAISLKTVGGTVGAIPHLATATAGTGFTVIGTASDTSVYNWSIIDQF